MTIYQLSEDKLNDFIIELQTLKGAIEQQQLHLNNAQTHSLEAIVQLKENTHKLVLTSSRLQVELSKIITHSYDLIESHSIKSHTQPQ